ncbi:hypothetical protein [Nocardia acidivorans]|nr:hypothetical protein [Nocardia acidivorans]
MNSTRRRATHEVPSAGRKFQGDLWAGHAAPCEPEQLAAATPAAML